MITGSVWKKSGPASVGIASLIISIAIAFFITDTAGGVVGLLRVPSVDPQFVKYVEDATGHDVIGSPGLGHDGKFFFVLAVDPFLVQPELNAVLLDRPEYRAQRMLYPLLAGGFGLLSPALALWGLLLVNVFAMGTGSWALSRISVALGGPPLLGLFFVFNPGLTVEMALDGSSVLGWALAAWGLAELAHRRSWPAALLLTLAVLARESLGIVAVGAFLFVWFTTRHAIWQVLVTPAMAATLWYLWVRSRVGGLPVSAEVQPFDRPLRGLTRAFDFWFETGGVALLLASVVLFCSLVVIASAWKRPNLLSWGTLGYVPLLIILHEDVLRDGLNLVRAVAPLLSAAFVLLSLAVTGRNGGLPERT